MPYGKVQSVYQYNRIFLKIVLVHNFVTSHMITYAKMNNNSNNQSNFKYYQAIRL